MSDLFISYSRGDRDRCVAIREELAKLKLDIWFDAGIRAGSSFDREIEREIAAARAVLVLWSEKSVDSDWVRNEARTGKERDGLIAVQLDECSLPLEFKSIQAAVLPEGAEGSSNSTWLGIVERIGELVERPGLAKYQRNMDGGTLEDWKTWLADHPSDPLAGDVIENIVELALPDIRQQLAAEGAKRAGLEAELAEQNDASKARSTEVATNARETVRLRQERDDLRASLREADAELLRFRNAVGSQKEDADGGLAGLGIVLSSNLALYLCALLWVVAIGFCWDPLMELVEGKGALSSVFLLIFGIAAFFGPAVLVTIKILRKRSANANEDEAPEPEE